MSWEIKNVQFRTLKTSIKRSIDSGRVTWMQDHFFLYQLYFVVSNPCTQQKTWIRGEKKTEVEPKVSVGMSCNTGSAVNEQKPVNGAVCGSPCAGASTVLCLPCGAACALIQPGVQSGDTAAKFTLMIAGWENDQKKKQPQKTQQ